MSRLQTKRHGRRGQLRLIKTSLKPPLRQQER
jgi:hypothetical protein